MPPGKAHLERAESCLCQLNLSFFLFQHRDACILESIPRLVSRCTSNWRGKEEACKGGMSEALHDRFEDRPSHAVKEASKRTPPTCLGRPTVGQIVCAPGMLLWLPRNAASATTKRVRPAARGHRAGLEAAPAAAPPAAAAPSLTHWHMKVVLERSHSMSCRVSPQPAATCKTQILCDCAIFCTMDGLKLCSQHLTIRSHVSPTKEACSWSWKFCRS